MDGLGVTRTTGQRKVVMEVVGGMGGLGGGCL